MTSDISTTSVRGAPHQRPHLFSLQNTPQVTCFEYIENDYRQVFLTAQRGRRMVHDGKVVGEQVHVVEPRQAHGVGILPRVPVVNPVHHVLGHEQGVGVDLQRPQRRPCVGGEERVARPRGEDHDTALLEVPDGAPADVRLGDLLDLDRGLDPGGYAASFEGGLQSHGVDDGAKHRHVVGCGPFYSELVGDVRTSEDVATAHDDGQLGPRLHSFENPPCRRVEAGRIDPVATSIAGEALPGELQDDALYGAELWERGPVGLDPGFGGLIQGRLLELVVDETPDHDVLADLLDRLLQEIADRLVRLLDIRLREEGLLGDPFPHPALDYLLRDVLGLAHLGDLLLDHLPLFFQSPGRDVLWRDAHRPHGGHV